MFNLFIGYLSPDSTFLSVDVDISRFLEYTEKRIQSEFKGLRGQAVRKIKQLPALCMSEQCKGGAFVAKIISISEVGKKYRIEFEKDSDFEFVSEEVITAAALELEIGKWEFNRTHWAIKSGDLKEILKENLIETVGTSEVSPSNSPPEDGQEFNKDQVFIVHGHDVEAKEAVKGYVESIGLEPIILHLQASKSLTIIEKIGEYSNVGFAITIYSECDIGAKKNSLEYRWRARQNVVFEHGYLTAKLGRDRVVTLVKGEVEIPNDISGIVYIPMDPPGDWINQINKELKALGYDLPSS